MVENSLEDRDAFHTRLRKQVKDLFRLQDISGIEVFSSMARVIQLLEMYEARQAEEGQAISGPRWRLLMHLFLAEQMANHDGITPTELSQFQQVSKNTISALLRGLEEQGYIVRSMDPSDLRVFRIHLSDAGRQAIMEMAPRRIQMMNSLIEGLSDDETRRLIELLVKLRSSLEGQVCRAEKG